jgi:tetratricopeptide (TPR) repeat protein
MPSPIDPLPPSPDTEGKSFLERLTGTTGKLVGFFVVVTALLTQIPALRTSSIDAYCSVVSCRVVDNAQTTENQEIKEARAKIDRHRLYAIQLVQKRDSDGAIAQLSDVLLHAEHILTSSVDDKILRGFIYKTYARAYDQKGDREQSKHYADLAIIEFKDARDAANVTTQERAVAIKGIGNIQSLMHDNWSALLSLKEAVKIDAKADNIWHDLFIAYFNYSRINSVDLAEMQEAYIKSKEFDVLTPDETEAFAQMFAEVSAKQLLPRTTE